MRYSTGDYTPEISAPHMQSFPEKYPCQSDCVYAWGRIQWWMDSGMGKGLFLTSKYLFSRAQEKTGRLAAS